MRRAASDRPSVDVQKPIALPASLGRAPGSEEVRARSGGRVVVTAMDVPVKDREARPGKQGKEGFGVEEAVGEFVGRSVGAARCVVDNHQDRSPLEGLVTKSRSKPVQLLGPASPVGDARDSRDERGVKRDDGQPLAEESDKRPRSNAGMSGQVRLQQRCEAALEASLPESRRVVAVVISWNDSAPSRVERECAQRRSSAGKLRRERRSGQVTGKDDMVHRVAFSVANNGPHHLGRLSECLLAAFDHQLVPGHPEARPAAKEAGARRVLGDVDVRAVKNAHPKRWGRGLSLARKSMPARRRAQR